MIGDMPINKKYNPILTKSFISDKNLNISFVSITQSYLAAPKYIRLK